MKASTMKLGWLAAVALAFLAPTALQAQETKKEAEGPTVDLTGTWEITMTTPRGERTSTLTFEMAEDGTLTGTMAGRGMGGETTETEIEDGWVTGNAFGFFVTRSFNERTMEIAYAGEVEGDDMSGMMAMGDQFSMDFAGKKVEKKTGDGS